MEQDLKTLDVTKLNPLSPEVISRQATINIGTIGHVAHGKSTVVKAISGVQTVRFKNELERNITIKLGYANAKIYKCEDDACPRPMCYKAYGSSKEDSPLCDVPGFEKARMKLMRHVSFVDCPVRPNRVLTPKPRSAAIDTLYSPVLTGTSRFASSRSHRKADSRLVALLPQAHT
ncbi:unnamed protein product, partial [Closterium sp. NIES-54]